MKKQLWIYDNHHDKEAIIADRELTEEECYCEACGDWDCLIAVVDTEAEARELVAQYNMTYPNH